MKTRERFPDLQRSRKSTGSDAFSLTRNGVEHEFITMSGMDHGFDGQEKDPAVRDAFDRALAFLDTHTAE